MKNFIVFMIISISIANCEEEIFGQRIAKSVTKTIENNTTNSNESVKTDKKSKDLDTHESYQTYEYALAPFEVQSLQPKVIAEEHTLHELSSPLAPALPMNEPIILTDNFENYGPNAKSLYGAQRMPKHYGSDLPIYRDDPKELLKGYLPIQSKQNHVLPPALPPALPSALPSALPLALPSARPSPQPPALPLSLPPALPMHALSQYKEDARDELAAQAKPIAYASAHKSPHASPHMALLGPHASPQSYGPQKIHRGGHSVHGDNRKQLEYIRQDHLDYIPGIPGTPWKDYPIYSTIPFTNFKCNHSPGYYADVEAGCQVWHYCQLDGRHDRFLCSNGTLFNQKTRVCDWYFNVHCASSISHYGVNADLYHVPKHHNKYLAKHQPHTQAQPPHNLINDYGITLDQIQSLASDLHNSGHGLIYSESQNVPQKQLIKRVRKVRVNKSNATDPGLTTKQIKH